MAGALWILAFVIVVGVVLYIGELRWRRNSAAAGGASGADETADADADADEKLPDDGSGNDSDDGDECCGQHLVCEKDTLSPVSDEIIYYDDDELDRFCGRSPESYTAEETEEFREILMTLRPDDVPGWARSITLRRIELPFDVRDELLMLVNERRGH